MKRYLIQIFWLISVGVILFFQHSCNENDLTLPPNDPEKISPVAKFSVNPTDGVAPLIVSFDASASSDQDGQIISYSWNFGDGSPIGNGATTKHTYQDEGNYNVILVITDNDGLTNSNSKQINVTSQTGPKLFPMYLGSQWSYNVSVYYKPLTSNSGSTEYGIITVTLVDYNSENNMSKLLVEGDLVYFNNQYSSDIIPKKVYILETQDALQRAGSSSGPWETTLKLNVSSWYNGGLILAGSNHRAFRMNQSSATTSAGVFTGNLAWAEENNWNVQYRTDDHEYYWKELINLQQGLIWSKRYIYFDDKGDQYGPYISSQEISLAGYAILLPDGSISQGGTGASIQLIANCEPGISYDDYPSISPPVIEDKSPHIQLSFSMDMNKSSVEQSLSIWQSVRPDLPGGFEKSGNITWQDNKHLIWVPDQPFTVSQYQKTYVFVTLKSNAHSIAGINLSKDVIFIFSIK